MTLRYYSLVVFLVMPLLAACGPTLKKMKAPEAEAKPRLLVLTDIGQDPDDQQSLVRILHYANEFDIEGFVATADSNFHWEAAIVRTDIIEEGIRRYQQILPNLQLHDPGFPSADVLLEGVKAGSPWGSVQAPVEDIIGPDKDTEGSEWIIQLVNKKDDRPLDVAIWGGAADLAQALWKVRENSSPEELARFVAKLRVHAIDDQDSTNLWILQEFPDLFYVRSQAPEGGKLASAYRGMFLGGDYSMLSLDWLKEHVLEGHGPLGEYYPTETWTADNPHGALKEGDTPSFFYFLRNGLQDPAHPDFGGWGGRFVRTETWFQDARDTVGDTSSYRATVWRWRTDYQNDFAARMDWGVKSYEEANHHPLAVLNGDDSKNILYRKGAPGQTVSLSAEGSTDPDGDDLSYRWWIYPEAGTSATVPTIQNASAVVASLTVPEDESGKTLHIILELTDNGAPPLKAYRRFVLEIE